MTQYARPVTGGTNPEHQTPDDDETGFWDGWLREDGSTWQNIYVSIDESSTNDSDYIKQSNSGNTLSWYEAKLGTVTDPVTALSDHKLKYRAVGYDSQMMGTPTLTVALYEGESLIKAHVNTSLEDESMMGMGTWADFTVSLSSGGSGEAAAIGDYSDLHIWFKMTSSNMGDYVKVSQAWFECADAPAAAAATSPAFLLFME